LFGACWQKATLATESEKLAVAAEDVSERDRQIEMLRQSLQQMATHNDLVESDVQKQKKTSDAIAKEMSEARDAVISHRLELEYLHEKLTATEEELVRGPNVP
jgi:t-SNARE complex subunit (syntaxin)